MKLLKFYLLYLLIFLPFAISAQNYMVKGKTEEVLLYKIDTAFNYSILHMGYASSVVKDPEMWNSKNKIIKEVDIVFTAYPKKKEEWITNYDRLLNNRIEAVQKMDPFIFNNAAIKWNFILQTACQNEEEAKRMFHGAIIKYASHSFNRKDTEVQEQSVAQEIINTEIETIAYGLSSFSDSIVFKTFDRNNWKKMLIVNDWTGSMYQYGAQAVLWHRLHYEKNAVKYFIFFNDGNKKPDRLKRIGNTGGIYYGKPDSIEYLLKVMKLVAKRGYGGDIPENNMEAILKAIKLFKGYHELVLIADNHASVRDIILLDKVTVPIKIILCGLERNQPIHPHYLEIARRTKGSIHTIEEDISGLESLKEQEVITISGIEYKVKKGKLVIKNSKSKTHAPIQVL